MAVVLGAKICSFVTFKTMNRTSKPDMDCANAVLSSQAALPSRRHHGPKRRKRTDGVAGAIKSLFDPNEKTKSGKLLPKAYLKAAREVVKNLRESLKEDTKDIAKFRRTADAAKESIREYLGSWRGQEKVVREESYVELEKAIRSLASFYSRAGPSAQLPEEVRSEILNDLNTAEEFL
ncbi:hypothetical protein POTOM_060499 [Populus tomentosa]|uniref:Uncharacterized protein n=1 Tax=Populus tomentosa TaxID=118781 RepID=A0A8X8BVU7_POPTO|nr:hypothetical protein POTOM_060499 [Populus tomentosa]